MVKYSGAAKPHMVRQGLALFETAEVGDQFGASVTVGDFDGDGFDDLAIGAPEEDAEEFLAAGVVHILYGSEAGLIPYTGQIWRADSDGIQSSIAHGDRFGARLEAGDFNCDGFDELVIGMPQKNITHNNGWDAGRVHVLPGSAGGLTAVDDRWFRTDSAIGGVLNRFDYFGDELAVGDFDGDGCDDLVIGARGEDFGGLYDSGNAYAVYGGPDGLLADELFGLHGLLEGDVGPDEQFGARLWARDADGDGFDDLVIMTPADGCEPGDKGFNYVYGGAVGLGFDDDVWMCREYDGP
jgi:hypothetical protein